MSMETRVRALNSAPLRRGARYMLYWAQMNRRVDYNHALVYAAGLANELDLPLLVYEGLTCTYPYASDRFHTFILEGVDGAVRRLAELGIGYAFHLRRRRSDPDDAMYRAASDAAAIVTDDYPVFVAARHNRSAPEKVGIPYYAVDSSCIVPMNCLPKREYAAYTVRPKIRRLLPVHLNPPPPLEVRRRWTGPPPAFHTEVASRDIPALVRSCEIDHSVAPAARYRGGAEFARQRLLAFARCGLRRYARERNRPEAHATSELSPYLHFGHISSLEVALEVMAQASEEKLIVDEFLEELIVRRELAFNFARHTDAPDSLEALPDWARLTMRQHAADKRRAVYTRDQFERAETHDALWNAAQKELLLRGRIHGYYRMYWGKKILEWSPTYEDALDAMIWLNDRYALDGRDPNSCTNILWCFGLHDRPWPERPIYGTLRSMSLEGMRRKTNVDAYLAEIRQLEKT